MSWSALSLCIHFKSLMSSFQGKIIILQCLKSSLAWVYFPLTLKRGGRDRRSFTLMDSPISVAILQCGIVGVNSMPT